MSIDCPICGDTFDELKSLFPHSRIHEQSWYESCKDCSFIAMTEDEWMEHQASEHNHIICPRDGCSVTAENGYALSLHWGQKHDGSLAEIHPEYDTSQSEEHIKNNSEALVGREPWNKGKSDVYSKETLQKMSESTKQAFSEEHPSKGRTLSEETKEKISESRTGVTEGADNPMYGKTGEEHPAYNRDISDKELEQRSGENAPLYGVTGEDHPAWSGGPSSFYQRDDWNDVRKSVYERDDYTCEKCKSRGGSIHAHHITPISADGDKLNMDNLITLCESCHRWVHNNPEQSNLIEVSA